MVQSATKAVVVVLLEQKERPMSHIIHFSVDGEEVTTPNHEMTPDQIIRDLGGKDPTQNYLVELHGKDKQESFKDRGEEPIHLHNNQRFIIISTGPTPVSDLAGCGRRVFADGLRKLGYAVELRDPEGCRITFGYPVGSGKFAGQTFQIGLEVPPDFPASVPGGPHVSPRIHGGRASGSAHPTSNIQESPNFGLDWEYWSRPFPNWQGEPRKTVETYLAHLWRLWDTQ